MPEIKKAFQNKIKNPIYIQMIIVVVAFIVMVVSSYMFVSNMEHNHLVKDSENIMSITENNIVSTLSEYETFLTSYSETIRTMILRGDEAHVVSEYMIEMTQYLIGNNERMQYLRGSHGDFFAWGGKYITGRVASMPEDSIPGFRPCYSVAQAANGEVVLSELYKGAISQITTLSMSRYLEDDEGNPMGVVCLDIEIDKLFEQIVSLNLTENSYGLLLDRNLFIGAHPDPRLMGENIRFVSGGFASLVPELEAGLDINERRIKNYEGKNIIVYFRKVKWDWLMGIAIPVNEYYKSMNNMALFLSAVGILLAAILCTMLFRLNLAKIKADLATEEKNKEIIAMKDSMKIGLFFMNKDFVIQENYSQYLEEMLSETELAGREFTDIISDSITANEVSAVKDYFKMVMERTHDEEILDDINPLTELHYVHAESGVKKVLQCDFSTVERELGEFYILVTVYDITARVELQEKLAEEEVRRQEEMQSIFELIKVEPEVFSEFMEDMENEFEVIEKTLRNDMLTPHEVVVKTYQSVHAIKSNAVILGLNVFGNKVHNLEAKIKKLREMEGEIPFTEMLNLTMEVEKLSQDKEGFRDTLDKLKAYTGNKTNEENQHVKILIDTMSKTLERISLDTEKQIQLVATDVDPQAVDSCQRRILKDILMQLVRNSAVHGIEDPETRKANGKNETGIVRLSIKLTGDGRNVQIRLSDDGSGLNYKKIAERALSVGLIEKDDVDNKAKLINALFAPGFSTADTEGIHAGRGIGMNLVRDRIKEANGSIKVHSEAGKGTTFLFSLPVMSAEAIHENAVGVSA